VRKVAVVGVGHTAFTRSSERTSVELFTEAAMDAITESNLKPKDIQALYLGNVYGDFEEGQTMLQAFVADSIGAFNIPVMRYESVCCSATVAVRDAFMWVASGFYDVVIAGGVEKAGSMGTQLATRTFAMGSDSRYEYPCGITFPAFFGLLTYLYSEKYGIPVPKLKEYMAMTSVQSHHYGVYNPKAHFRKEITMEAALSGFVVSTPLQLYDCCPLSDGAAAVVLASEEAAKKLTSKPVYIIGVGLSSQGALADQGNDLPRLKAREVAVKQAYNMAGVKPQDIDLCELHDCFSIASLIDAEGLGFFDYGKSGEAWEKGDAAIGGKVAINPSGGLKAKGHPIGATGAGQVYEVVKQLRGEVEPERLVEGARLALTDTAGGDAGSVCNLILERGW